MQHRLTRSSWRLAPLIAGLATLTLLVLGLLIVAQSESTYRSERARDVEVQARILASNVTAALDFADLQATREAVAALKVNPQLRIAAVYDVTGKLVTGFSRTAALPPRLPRAGADLTRLDLLVPVARGASRIGTVYLSADIDPLSRRLPRYGLIAMLIGMATLIVGILGLAQSTLRRANAQLTAANLELKLQIEGRAAAEQQLRQAQKMEAIGQLTGGIAHDFNNMLAIVIGSLDMARRRLTTAPERALQGLDNAMEGATRAASLTRRLLAFSRQQPLEPQVLDINKLVGGMSELLRRTIGEQLRVETILGGGLWRVHADPGQLENAVLNLCVNARDAMADGGNLTIETMNAVLDETYVRSTDNVVPGQYVVVAISDTGMGMPPEVRDRAFEPFFTTKGVGKGTGLGLSQIYGFVRQSGGHVQIYSEVGQGTTVKLYLPRHHGSAEIAEARIAETVDLPLARPGEVVLVVEDEAAVRAVSVDTLRDLGYTVLEAGDGDEGLARLRDHPEVRLLFTDIMMPGMTGRQLADLACAARPDLRVVFTTGYTRNAVVHNGMLDAGVAFLPKPFTVQQLALKIRAVFDGGGVNRPAAG